MIRWTCCLCTVGQVVHTLPQGGPVWGVALLDDEVYVLRSDRNEVDMYDVINYRIRLSDVGLSVPNILKVNDMISCAHYRCLYIVNIYVECVYRLDVVRGSCRRWAVNDVPAGISVNAEHNVLVTCPRVRKIKELSSRGDLLRELTLPDDVINPWHAIQTRNGEFIVCHGGLHDAVHRVCKISADGHNVIQSHGGLSGSDVGQYDSPVHLAVDNNGFVFVADFNNRRVTLLSPTLSYIRQVVSPDDLKWKPERLRLDIHRRRLYVVDNRNYKHTAGRVVVFSV